VLERLDLKGAAPMLLLE